MASRRNFEGKPTRIVSGTARQSTLSTRAATPAEPRLATTGFRSGAHGRWWRDALRRRLLAGCDLMSVAISLLIVVVPATGNFWSLAFLPLWPLLAKLFGLYDRDHRALRHLTADEVPTILAWTALLTAVSTLLLTLTPSETLSAERIVELFIATSISALALRSLCRWGWAGCWTRSTASSSRARRSSGS
jgi:hypothetical protein